MEQEYAALQQLERAQARLRQAAKELPALRGKVMKLQTQDFSKAKSWYEVLQNEKALTVERLKGCCPLLREIDESGLAAVAGNLARALNELPVMTRDYSKVSEALSVFAQRLPTPGNASARTIGHLMNNVKLGHYPTDPEHLDYLLKGIRFPAGITSNLLDPCCGEGNALRQLAVGNGCMTYGAELDPSRAEEAQTKLHRVAIGDYFRAKISHGAFHLLLLNPPYLFLGQGANRVRAERRFLAEALCHLMLGGLLIYIIPYYRLTPDIAQILCGNFDKLTLYRFEEKEFSKFKQIAVCGVRKAPDGGEEFLRLAARAEDAASLPGLSGMPAEYYELPPVAQEVAKFQGEIFNERELARQLKSSRSLEPLYSSSALDRRDRRPLLPLSVGQVGLIGGSGLINGLADCDQPHILKGRIIKEIVRDEQVIRQDSMGRPTQIEVTETHTNRLIFNILTPGGFKSLA